MDKQNFFELIDKYQNNTATDSERLLVEEYYRRLEGIDEEQLSSHEEKFLKEKIYQQIVKKSFLPTKHKRAGIIQIARYAIAAALIGIIAIAGIKLLTERVHVSKGTTAVMQSPDSIPRLVTIENNTGQVMQARLSDNSLVTVYPNSSLQYLPVFEMNKRDLYLKGKVKFKVSKDPSRPFTVYAAGISTTAIGTEFFITVNNNRQVSVALLEGIVRVGSQDKADKNSFVVLHPGDNLVLNSGQFNRYSLQHNAGKNQDNPATRHTVKDKPVIAENKLVFKNERLKVVLKKIEEKFGVSIHYEKAPGIEEKLFTGTFFEKDDLEFIIKVISHLHGLKYSIEGNSVTISGE